MKIAIGCDHGGLALKNAVKEWLKANGYEAVDFGTDSFASCDYPDMAEPACSACSDAAPEACSDYSVCSARAVGEPDGSDGTDEFGGSDERDEGSGL